MLVEVEELAIIQILELVERVVVEMEPLVEAVVTLMEKTGQRILVVELAEANQHQVLAMVAAQVSSLSLMLPMAQTEFQTHQLAEQLRLQADKLSIHLQQMEHLQLF
jgi:predicted RNA-binding protein with PIN domain